MAEGIERVALDDPARCQAVTPQGQCQNRVMEGSNTCKVHGGSSHQKAAEKASMNRYRVAKWNDRIARFGGDADIKNIRDEIGILRMLLEERLVAIGTPMDLILQSGPISDLVSRITCAVQSCHKLEQSMGQLLDKQQIMQFADRVISIVSECVKDTEVVEEISRRIAEQ